MNAWIGWALATVAVVLACVQYGAYGAVFAATLVVFWLLLQFSKALRIMRGAAHQPVGHVANAVMLQAKLRTGMRLIEIIGLTRSLGQRVPTAAPSTEECWRWTDAGGDSVEVWLQGGRCTRWDLRRVDPSPPDAP